MEDYSTYSHAWKALKEERIKSEQILANQREKLAEEILSSTVLVGGDAIDLNPELSVNDTVLVTPEKKGFFKKLFSVL